MRTGTFERKEEVALNVVHMTTLPVRHGIGASVRRCMKQRKKESQTEYKQTNNQEDKLAKTRSRD